MRRQSLRVLMISTIFYPKVDGSVIAVSNMLRCLRECGHIVYLITRKLHKTMPKEKWQDISVVRVGPSGPSLVSRLILSLNQARVGFTIMKNERIDIIHAHGIAPLLAGLMLSKLFHRPVAVSFHGFQRLWFKSVRWKRESTLALTYPFEKFLINMADAIVAQSGTLKRVISRMYKIKRNKVRVIPNVVDEERFKFVSPRSSNEPTVLFVGTLAKVQGIDLLIKAAPIVLKDVPQAKFMIVGKGPQKEYLQRLIKDLSLEKSVFLLGPIFDRNELARCYATASVVVVPLKYKGYILSLVAMEAMSTGRPVVTTMTLDPDLLRYGVYKADVNPAKIAQAIIEILLLDKEAYAALAISARGYIEEQCSREAVASRLEDLYSQLIGMH